MNKQLRPTCLRWFLVLAAQGALFCAVVAQNHCKVRYTYNASGDRIQRDRYCWTPGHEDKEEVLEDKSLASALEEVHLTVVPNPAATSIAILLPDAALGGTLELLSTTGALLATIEATTSQQEMDVSALNAGHYLLRLTKGDEMIITSFVVER